MNCDVESLGLKEVNLSAPDKSPLFGSQPCSQNDKGASSLDPPTPLGRRGHFGPPLGSHFDKKNLSSSSSRFILWHVAENYKQLTHINTLFGHFWGPEGQKQPKTTKIWDQPVILLHTRVQAGWNWPPPQPWRRAIPIITNFKNYAPPPPKKKRGSPEPICFSPIKMYPNIRRTGSQINQIIWLSIYKLTKKFDAAFTDCNTQQSQFDL